MDNLDLYIESLVFATVKPISIKEIKQSLHSHFSTQFKEKDLRESLDRLGNKYNSEEFPFEIIEIAGGFQFMTKGLYYPLVSQYLRLESKKRLSKSALETLAIISYKQPVTKTGLETIRGVNCDYAVQKLLEKELVEMVGRAEGPGRPLLYGTTEKFLNHFGLKDLQELPKIKEFDNESNEIGTPESFEVSEQSESTPIVITDKSDISKESNLAEQKLSSEGDDSKETTSDANQKENIVGAEESLLSADELVRQDAEEIHPEVQESIIENSQESDNDMQDKDKEEMTELTGQEPAQDSLVEMPEPILEESVTDIQESVREEAQESNYAMNESIDDHSEKTNPNLDTQEEE